MHSGYNGCDTVSPCSIFELCDVLCPEGWVKGMGKCLYTCSEYNNFIFWNCLKEVKQKERLIRRDHDRIKNFSMDRVVLFQELC